MGVQQLFRDAGSLLSGSPHLTAKVTPNAPNDDDNDDDDGEGDEDEDEDEDEDGDDGVEGRHLFFGHCFKFQPPAPFLQITHLLPVSTISTHGFR